MANFSGNTILRQLAIFCVLFFITVAAGWAQTQGVIYKPAEGEGRLILDPSGTGNVFDGGSSANDFVIPYSPLIQLQTEPEGDVRTGPWGGHTDLISKSDGESPVYMYYDSGNDALLFRVRLGGESTASKGYSFLFNTDVFLFGPKAENFSSTNPGFQFEIVLETGNGVSIYEWDGDTEVGTKNTLTPINNYFQKSISENTIAGGTGFFYDFYVPLSEINSKITAQFDSTTTFRVLATTITRAQSGINGTISDIGCVDDDRYRSTTNGLVNCIEVTPEVSAIDLKNGDGFTGSITSKPSVDTPISEDDTSISGTSVEDDGTSITVFINGSSAGSATVSDNSWTLSNLTLTAGDEVTAEAHNTGAGKNPSGQTDPVNVFAKEFQCTEAPISNSGGGRTVSGTVPNVPSGMTVADLTIRIYYTDGTIYASSDPADNPEVPGTIDLLDPATGEYKFSQSTGGNNLRTNDLTDKIITAQFTGQCESNYAVFTSTNLVITDTPVITTSEITETSLSQDISGTSEADAMLYLYYDGSLIDSITADASGNWTITVAGDIFVAGGEVYARAAASGEVLSEKSNSVTVVEEDPDTSLKPVILGEYLNEASITITGYTDEGAGVKIVVYVGGLQVSQVNSDAFGNWELIDIDLLGDAGNNITATAQADGELVSPSSNPVTIQQGQTTAPTIEGGVTSQIVSAFNNNISISSGGTTNRIYIDGGLVLETASSSVAFSTLSNNGSNTIGDLVQPGVEVFATVQNSNEIESDFSNIVSVQEDPIRYISVSSISPEPAPYGGDQDVDVTFRVLDNNFAAESGVAMNITQHSGQGNLAIPNPAQTDGSGLITVTYTTTETDNGATISVQAVDDDGLGDPYTASFEVQEKPPVISKVSLGDDGSDNITLSFDSDKQLGSDETDIAVTVTGPGSFSQGFGRSDFDESQSDEAFTYTLKSASSAAYGDEGTYAAAIDDAKDSSGNDGADGSQTDTYIFSSDSESPVVTISTPADGAVVQNQNTVLGNAVDNVGVTVIELEILRNSDSLFWNGSGWQADQIVVSASASDGVFNSGDEDWIYDSSDISGDDTYTVMAIAGDAAGNNGNSESVSYTIDGTAPTLTSSTPADDTTDVSVDANIEFEFSENVVQGTGTVELYSTNGDALIESFDVVDDAGTGSGQIVFNGSTVTLNPTDSLEGVTSYYIQVDETSVEDTAGNTYAGISNETGFNFETAAGPPADISLTGPGNVTAGEESENFTLTVLDAQGNETSVTQNTAFNLSSDQSGAVFTPASPIMVANGDSGAVFSYSNATVGDSVHTITATWDSENEGTDLGTASHDITVNPGDAAQILVEMADDGSGSVLGDSVVISGNTIIAYAIARDEYDNFVELVTDPVWSLTNKTEGVADGNLSDNTGGSATFSANLVGTGTINAEDTAAELTATPSGIITVEPGDASRLVIVEQPVGASSGDELVTQPEIAIQDAAGNRVMDDNTTEVKVDLSSGANGSLGGTQTNPANNGLAVFGDLTLAGTATEDYEFTFSDVTTGREAGDLLTATTSNTINVTAGAASGMTVSTQPGNTVAGETIEGAPAVTITDSEGNPTFGIDVTVNINKTDFTSGTLTQTTSASGVAVFNDLVLDTTGNGYELTFDANASGVTNVISRAFEITPAPASNLVITQQPSGGTGNENNSATGIGSVILETYDEYGNKSAVGLDAQQDVSVALENDPTLGEASLSGVTMKDIQSGTATFGDLTLDRDGTGFTLRFSSGSPVSLGTTDSDLFNMTGVEDASSFDVALAEAGNKAAGTVFDLDITNATGTNGSDLSGEINVTVNSDIDNEVHNAAVTFTSGSASVPVTLTSATDYELTVNVTGVTSDKYINVIVEPGTADPANTTIAANPTTITADETDQSEITITVKDSYGNTRASGGDDIFADTDLGTLGTISDSNDGTYTANLTGTNTGTAMISGYLGTDNTGDAVGTAEVTLEAGAPASISLTGPTSVIAGEKSGNFMLTVFDAHGNETSVTQDTDFTLSSEQEGSIFNPASPVIIANGNSTATFTYFNTAVGDGTHTIEAAWNSGGDDLENTTHDIDVTAGDLDNFLVEATGGGNIAQQTAGESFDIDITARDAWYNKVSDYSGTAELTLNQGLFSDGGGEMAAFVNGMLSGHTVQIDGASAGYEITATNAGVGSEAGTSNSFAVNAGPIAVLDFSQEPTNSTAEEVMSPAVTVQLLDSFDNNVSQDNVGITLSVRDGATLSNGSATTDPNGLATYNSLSVTEAGTGYLLKAELDGSDPAISQTSTSFDVTTGSGVAANSSATVPDGTAGESTELTITVLDSKNNAVTGAASDLEVTVSGGPNAGATFTPISDEGDGAYTTGYTPVNTGDDEITIALNSTEISGSPFTSTVTAGAAAEVVVTSFEQTVPTGENSSNITIELRDANGNAATAGTGGITFDLVTDGDGEFRNTGNEDTVISVSIADGSSNNSFRYYSETASVDQLSVTDQNESSGVGSANQNVTIEPAPISVAGNGSELSGADLSRTADGSEAATIIVQLKDEFGNNIEEQDVDVLFATTGGILSTASTATDAGGQTSVTLTSTNAGDFEVTAKVDDSGDDTADADVTNGSPVEVSFNAGAVANLAINAGNNQNGEVATTIENPLEVKVTDANDNPLENITVNFTISDEPEGTSGSTLSSSSVTTDADGLASVDLTFGDLVGTYEVTAASGDLSDVTFTATATADAPDQIVKISGDGQSDIDGATLDDPFVIRIEDQYGNPIVDQLLTFSITNEPDGTSGSSLSTESITTDGSGEASSTLTFGDRDGSYEVTVSSGSMSDVIFTATAIPGNVDLAKSTITADPTTLLADGSSTSEITVQLKDANGNNLTTSEGAVTLSTTIGYAESVTDNGDGTYSATFVSETSVGTATITGRLEGDDFEDSAEIELVSGAPSLVTSTITANDNSLVADGNSSTIVTLQLKDENGNNVTTGGDDVTLGTDAGSLDSVSDNGNGIYTATLTSPTSLAMATITGMLNGAAIEDNAVVEFVAGSPDNLIMVSGNNQADLVGESIDDSLRVQVTDANDNPVQGATIDFDLTEQPSGAKGAVLSSNQKITDGNGLAAALLTLGDQAGMYTIEVSGGSLYPVSFSAEATAGLVDAILKISGDDQVQPTLSVLDDSLVVQVQDQFGNPVPDYNVSYTITDQPENAEGAELISELRKTDSQGYAFSKFKLGSNGGDYTIAASAENHSGTVLFTATGKDSRPDPTVIDTVNTVVFNGSEDSYMYAEPSASLDELEDMSVEIWILPHSLSGSYTIMDKTSDDNPSENQFSIGGEGNTVTVELYTDQDEPVMLEADNFFVEQSEEQPLIASSQAGFNQNSQTNYKWTHLAVTVDSENGTARFYRNGFRIDETSFEGVLNTGSKRLTMGAGFDGEIHEVRIWNTARTRNELQSNLTRILSGNEENLVLYHTFDDDDADVDNDLTDNKNDLFLSDNVGRNFSIRGVTDIEMLEGDDYVMAFKGVDEDGDELEAIINTLPQNGRLYQVDNNGKTIGKEITSVPTTLTDSENRAYYKPYDYFFGEDQLDYTLEDLHGNRSGAVREITIHPVNNAPQVDFTDSKHITFNQRDTMSVDLTQFVDDVDNALNELSWSATVLDQEENRQKTQKTKSPVTKNSKNKRVLNIKKKDASSAKKQPTDKQQSQFDYIIRSVIDQDNINTNSKLTKVATVIQSQSQSEQLDSLVIEIDNQNHRALFTTTPAFYAEKIPVLFKAQDLGQKIGADTVTVSVNFVNDPPSPFAQLLPAKDDTVKFSDIKKTVQFTWEQTTDIEQDSIKYIFELTREDGVTKTMDNLADTSLVINRDDPVIEMDKNYTWRVWATDKTDTTASSKEKTFVAAKDIPLYYKLSQNYPNPFNPTTKIEYWVPIRSRVEIRLYNIIGQRIAILEQGEVEQGLHAFDLNARELSLASGVYFYRMAAEGISKNVRFVKTRKFTLIK